MSVPVRVCGGGWIRESSDRSCPTHFDRSGRPMHVSFRCVPYVLLTILLIVAGCDKETIGPQTEGAIAGEVQDARTNAPISTANVTTSPPTQSVITDGEGRFVFGGVPPGNYTVEATKVDYKARSVQVKVRNEDTTSATILLERTEEFGPRSDSLVALVTN